MIRNFLYQDVFRIYLPPSKLEPRGWWGQSPVLFAKPFPPKLQEFQEFAPRGRIDSITPQGWWSPPPPPPAVQFRKPFPDKLQQFQEFAPRGVITVDLPQGWWTPSPVLFRKPFPIALQPFASSYAPVDFGLIHRWPMDTAHLSGSTVSDTVGNDNGTKTAGVTLTTGPTGVANTALAFDGVAGSDITLASSPRDWNAGSFTVAGWVWITDNNSLSSGGSNQTYFIDDRAGDGTNYVRLYNRIADGAGELTVSVSKTTLRSDAGKVPSQTWTYVALTNSGGGSGGTLTTYINGLPVSMTPLGAPGTVDASFLTISSFFGAASAIDSMLTGRLADWVIYNKALSAAEILQLYIATGPTLPPQGWWGQSPTLFAKPYPVPLQQFPSFALFGPVDATVATPQGWWGQPPALFAKPFSATLQQFQEFAPLGPVGITPQGWWTPPPALFAKLRPISLQQFQSFVPLGQVGVTPQGWWTPSPVLFAKPYSVTIQQFQSFALFGPVDVAAATPQGWWTPPPALFRKVAPATLQQFQSFAPMGTIGLTPQGWWTPSPALFAKPFPAKLQQTSNWAVFTPVAAAVTPTSNWWGQSPVLFRKSYPAQLQRFQAFAPQGAITAAVPTAQGWWGQSPWPVRKRFPVQLQQFTYLSFHQIVGPTGEGLKNEIGRLTWMEGHIRVVYLKNENRRQVWLQGRNERVVYSKNEIRRITELG